MYERVKDDGYTLQDCKEIWEKLVDILMEDDNGKKDKCNF